MFVLYDSCWILDRYRPEIYNLRALLLLASIKLALLLAFCKVFSVCYDLHLVFVQYLLWIA